MKVDVRLTARDFLAFAIWYYWHNLTTWILALVAISLSMVQSMKGMARDGLTGIEIGSSIVTLVLMMLLCWVLLVAVGTVVLIFRNRRNSNCTIELSEEGIVEETPHARLQMGWEAVRKPGITRRYIFLRGMPGTTQLIPRRAFADDAAWNECVELCKRRAVG